jgi:hypothetical protein
MSHSQLTKVAELRTNPSGAQEPAHPGAGVSQVGAESAPTATAAARAARHRFLRALIPAIAAGQPDERIQRQARWHQSARRFAICSICDAGGS